MAQRFLDDQRQPATIRNNQYVPYRGAAPALNDVVAGHV